MEKLREKDIEKVLVAKVKNLGGRAYKWVSPGNDGVPDRIVVFPGRPPVFVELKSETGRLSALQTIQIDRLAALGQTVYIVKGIAGLKQFFEKEGYIDTASVLAVQYGL